MQDPRRIVTSIQLLRTETLPWGGVVVGILVAVSWVCHGNWFGRADCVPGTNELIGEDLGAIISLDANQ